MAELTITEKFTMAHNTLNMVDLLLVEAGFKQDSSVRHNLKIAKSMFEDAEGTLNPHYDRTCPCGKYVFGIPDSRLRSDSHRNATEERR